MNIERGIDVFLQSGTGAVSRPILDKLRDELSVFDFMTAAQIADVKAYTAAVDVTAAINAALAAAAAASSGHVLLKFPAGRYAVSSGIVFTGSYFSVEGDRAELLATAVMGSVLTIGDGASFFENLSVIGMRFMCDGKANYGMRVRNGQNLRFRDLSSYASLLAGYFIDGVDNQRVLNLKFSNCLTSANTAYGFYLNANGNTASFSEFDFDSCSVDGVTAATRAFQAVGANQMKINGGAYQNYVNYGLYADGAGVTIENTHFESAQVGAVGAHAINTSRLIIRDNASVPIVETDPTSTAFVPTPAFLNSNNYLKAPYRVGALADIANWGNPSWTGNFTQLSGRASVKGQIFTDKYGVRWMCRNPGVNSVTVAGSATWLPLDGWFIIPFDYTQITNGNVFWYAMEDFIVTEMMIHVIATFTATGGSTLSIGTDGVNLYNWSNQALVDPATELVADANINFANNLDASALLANNGFAYLAGHGCRIADAASSAIRIFKSGTWSAGTGLLIVRGINAVFD